MQLERVFRERLSRQICRIVCIMQVLYRVSEATAFDIHALVNTVLPSPVCERTIRRDLHALAAVEFIESRKVKTRRRLANGFLAKQTCLYALKPPGLINDRIDEFLRRRGANRDRERYSFSTLKDEA